jgi:hypothetical protein
VDRRIVWEPSTVTRFAEQVRASRAALAPASAALRHAGELVLARPEAVVGGPVHEDARRALAAMAVGIADDAHVLARAAHTSAATEHAIAVLDLRAERRHVVDVALSQVGSPWRPEYAGAQPPAPTLWCGEFVSWAYAESGHPLPAAQTPGASGFASVPAMVDWVQRHAAPQWHAGASDVRAGDIVVVDGEGHVALATGPVHDGVVPTVDGNWGGHVARTAHAVTDVVGTWRPLT